MVAASASDDTGNTGQKSRHAMKIVNTACIVKIDCIGQGGLDENDEKGFSQINAYLDERVAQDGQDTGNGTNQNGTPWLNRHRSGGTHCDTSGKCGILNMLHGDLAARRRPHRSGIGHHARAAESQVGVDNGEVAIGTGTRGGVEGGPEHPQEYGTNERENVGVVLAAYGS